MGRFINDKVICSILNVYYNKPYQLIETTMNISPFGISGKKTYIATIKNEDEKIENLEINEDLYNKYYIGINKK